MHARASGGVWREWPAVPACERRRWCRRCGPTIAHRATRVGCCDEIQRLLCGCSSGGTERAVTWARRRAVEARMAVAISSASDRVPISCAPSKRSAPAQMRVTASGVLSGGGAARRSKRPARHPRRNRAAGRRRKRHRNECCADDDWDRAHRSDHASEPLHGRSIGALLRPLDTQAGMDCSCWRPRAAVVRSWLVRDEDHFSDSWTSRGAGRRS